MPLRDRYRDRQDTDVAILEALTDRSSDGLTIFEIRARIDADIDELEQALERLKTDELISVNPDISPTRVQIQAHALTDQTPIEESDSIIDRLRRRLPR